MSEVYEANVNAMHREAEWQIEARETAARINNDIQELMATAEAVFMRWAEDGLLDRTHRVTQFDHSVGRNVLVELPRMSPLAASARWARAIRGVAEDALSVSAREAVDAQ